MTEERQKKTIREESTFERILKWLAGLTMGSIVILFNYQYFRTGKLSDIPSTLLALIGIEFGALMGLGIVAVNSQRELETEGWRL